MAHAVERNFLAGSVKANNVKNDVTVVKNAAGAVGVGHKKFVLHFEWLVLYAEVGDAVCVNANDGAIGCFAIKKTIGKHSLAKFAVATVKTGAVQDLLGGCKQFLLFEGVCLFFVIP